MLTQITGTPGTRVVTVFGEESYHELYYYIHIRRRTLAYGINLIIPSLVISMMTVLGFTLPPDACEKITLETTVLLSVIFFLQMVSNMSPPQSKSVPILAAFFSCCLMVVACSCVFTVLTICLHRRKAETHEMSPLMRRVFVEWLPYILMMRTPDHPRAPKPKVIDKTILPVHRLSTLPILSLPRPSTITSEWRFAAMAVDRMCLYLFSIFIAVSTCGIIMPHIIMGLRDTP
uniref:Neurotransmitter-gated ion-channel ligand-binding and Neurotransmitter-gated ion-channel transmembrane region domain containing protein n=1 Tax=Haemonchus contortus TaxID=6289 RepID=W6NE58_HAECO